MDDDIARAFDAIDAINTRANEHPWHSLVSIALRLLGDRIAVRIHDAVGIARNIALGQLGGYVYVIEHGSPLIKILAYFSFIEEKNQIY